MLLKPKEQRRWNFMRQLIFGWITVFNLIMKIFRVVCKEILETSGEDIEGGRVIFERISNSYDANV
jgi:hypothetical protein